MKRLVEEQAVAQDLRKMLGTLVMTGLSLVVAALPAFADARITIHQLNRPGNPAGQVQISRVRVNTAAANKIGCTESATREGTPLARTCYSTSGAGANVGYANATIGSARSGKAVSFTKGIAYAGLGVSAAGDTAVSDSFVVSYGNTGATQTTLTINGRAFVDGQGGRPGIPQADLRVIVYPDSATADLDGANLGNGALFFGKLLADSSSFVASGGFTALDFASSSGGVGRLQVLATNLTKNVIVPDTSKVVVRVVSHATLRSGGVAVPGLSTQGIVLVFALLLAIGGWMLVVRRQQSDDLA